MRKLRLILFEECDRACEGCCNNDWDIKNLPILDTFKGYDLVMLTGGEPMLNRRLLMDTIIMARKETSAPIYLYTAKSNPIEDLLYLITCYVDGVTLTLHEPLDVEPFNKLNEELLKIDKEVGFSRSLRLNIFKGVDITGINTELWKVKDDIEWIKDCPLPEDEELKRLSN